MTRNLANAMLALALAAPTAGLAEVAPQAVAFAPDGSVAQLLTGVPGDPEAGARDVADRTLGNCVACHRIGALPEVPFQGTIGPSLDGAGSRWSAAQLRGIVADAKHTFPDSMMPGFYKAPGYIRPGAAFTGKPAEEPLPPLLSARQVEDITAWLLMLN